MDDDPVLVAMNQADGPTRAWLAAVRSHVAERRATQAEAETLGVLAQSACDEVKHVALEQEDEGSSERWF